MESTELARILSDIDDLKQRLDTLRPLDREQKRRVMQKLRLEWNYHSNAIEGNTLTYGETRAFLMRGITAKGKPFKDYLDIRGHNEAIEYLLAVVRDEEVITEAMIRELHTVLLPEPYKVEAETPGGGRVKRTVTPGQYKTMPNNVLTSTGEVHYYATPQETPAKMADLVRWLRRQSDAHPLLVAALFHFRFVAIHPFDDGNGRMARLLTNLLLMRSGYVPLVVRNDDREAYLLALEEADAGETEAFVVFTGERLVEALRLFVRAAQGEEVEEEDDLDKKIRLLSVRLRSAENLDSNKSEEHLQRLADELFIPLINGLDVKLALFDEVFAIANTHLLVHDGTKNKSLTGEFKREGTSALKRTLREAENAVMIQFSRSWKGFVSAPTRSLHCFIKFPLLPERFSVIHKGTAKGGVLLTSDYARSFGDEEVASLVRQIAGGLYSVVDGWVSENGG